MINNNDQIKILVLSSDIPSTTNMPGSPRLFNFCRQLSKKHCLSLKTLSQNTEKYRQFLTDPYSHGVFSDITVLPNCHSCTWLNKQNHRLHLACHFNTKYLFPEYHLKISNYISEQIRGANRPDIIYVDGLSTAQYLPKNSDIPVVVDFCDSLTLFYERLTKMTQPRRAKLATYLEKHSIAKMEKSVAESVDLVITASSIDESAIKKLSPISTTVTIANGVDSEYFFPSDGLPNCQKLIFTGVMDYGPNEDAVLYFCREIFPRVKERVPGAEFWIVGQGPTAQVQSLTQQHGVKVTGKVSDVRPYLQAAGIFVCPLRYGAGIKNKILAAMAMRRPVVATALSIEGIDAKPDEEILVANDPEDFVNRISELMVDERLAQRLVEKAYRLVKDQYSWETRGKFLESALKYVMQRDKGYLSSASPSLTLERRRPNSKF